MRGNPTVPVGEPTSAVLLIWPQEHLTVLASGEVTD